MLISENRLHKLFGSAEAKDRNFLLAAITTVIKAPANMSPVPGGLAGTGERRYAR